MQKCLGRAGLSKVLEKLKREQINVFSLLQDEIGYIAISTRVIGCFYEGLKEEAKECKVRDKDFGRKAR